MVVASLLTSRETTRYSEYPTGVYQIESRSEYYSKLRQGVDYG